MLCSEAATQSPLRVSHVHKFHLILLLQTRLIRPTRLPRCSCHFLQSFPHVRSVREQRNPLYCILRRLCAELVMALANLLQLGA
jgi:hypothetical protein